MRLRKWLAIWLIELFAIAPLGATPLCNYTLDDTLVDATGNYANLGQSGTVVFTNSPAPPVGTKWASISSVNNYPTLPAALVTALGALTAYDISFTAVQPHTISGTPYMWRTDNALTLLQVLSTGQFRFCSGDVSHILGSSLGAISVDTTYTDIGIRVVGTARTLRINGASVSTDAFGTALAAFTTSNIGHYDGSIAFWDGYLAGFKIDDTTPTATPTPTNTATFTPTPTPTPTKTPTPTNWKIGVTDNNKLLLAH